MKNIIFAISISLFALGLSSSAQAGTLTGAAIGAGGGALVAGPVGAVAGGVAGAAIGGPNIHRYHHHRIRADAKGRRFYSVHGRRHYL
jgi:osmotically inducible lipoprotein OsmB